MLKCFRAGSGYGQVLDSRLPALSDLPSELLMPDQQFGRRKTEDTNYQTESSTYRLEQARTEAESFQA